MSPSVPGRLAGIAALALLAAGACDAEPRERSAAERGRELFSSSALSRNSYNELACSDCHAVAPDDGRMLPGAPMPGVVLRPSYWGGDEVDLLRSLNACLTAFMIDTRGLDPDDPRAADLYAYLASLPPTQPEPYAFTFVREVGDAPAGDALRGEGVYNAACVRCHGAPYSGEGRGVELAGVVPTETIAEHGGDPTYNVRRVLAEKIRHGRYFGFGGLMPPFSAELLSDQDVGDILAYFGQ